MSVLHGVIVVTSHEPGEVVGGRQVRLRNLFCDSARNTSCRQLASLELSQISVKFPVFTEALIFPLVQKHDI